jgi:hypothetical protein
VNNSFNWLTANRTRRNTLVGDAINQALDKLVTDRWFWLSLACIIALLPFGVNAITAPASGSFAYDLYDVGVNDIVKGAPGFVGGVAGVAYSATKLSTDWKAASLGILASTMVIKADAVTTSLGALI